MVDYSVDVGGSQAFLTAPLPVGKAKRWGGIRKVARVFKCWCLERFHFAGLGLRLFQLPNSYPCLRVQIGATI